MKKLLVALALVLSTAIFGTTACETKKVDNSSSSSSVEQSVSSSSNEETSSPEDSSSVEEPSNPETSSPEDSSSVEEPSNPETSSPEDSSSAEEPSNPETSSPEDSSSVEEPSNPGTSSPEDSTSTEEPSNPGTSSPENSSSAEDTSSSVEDSSSEEKKTFTVTLLNEDGTEFKVIKDVPEGTTAEVIYGKDYIPTKEGYIFDGWDLDGYTVKETDVVTQDLTLKAKFVASTYTITWIVEGVTSTTDGIYDQKPVFKGETPTKAGDDKYVSYNFVGWTDGENTYAPDELPVVTGAQIYTAVFEGGEKQIYTITWVIGEYDERTSEIAYGEKTVYDGDAFTKEGDAQYVSYNFVGWQVGETVYAPDELPVVTGPQTYTAVFVGGELKQYTITWLNPDGTELSSGKVAYGTVPSYDGTPTFAPTAQFTYKFESWDKEVVAVVGDATYTAVYEEIVNKYTITWVNDNGDELEVDTEVEYGATPSYDGEVPTKVEDDFYTYTFNAWSPEIAEVVGDATYTATYTAEGKLYTVNWVIGEKTLTSSVEYGKVPTFEGTSADLYKYGYEFIGWSDTADGEVITLPAVDGTETYYAVFSDTSVWDGKYPTLASGATAETLFTKDANGNYLIQSAKDLATLSALTQSTTDLEKWTVFCSGEKYLVTINIDMSAGQWKPIANGKAGSWAWNCFAGTFDGGNHTITLNVNDEKGMAYGLFESLSGATVKNVIIGGEITAQYRVGAVAYITHGTNTVQNVTSNLNITTVSTADSFVGGIIGAIGDGALTLENCTNNGTIKAAGHKVGGIFGSSTGESATITDCSNTAGIEGNSHVGGIFGIVSAGTSTITNSTNTGKISATGSYAGGLVGNVSVGACTITNSTNTGKISATGNYAGGIVGYSTSGTTNTITGCENEGNVSATSFIGGIVGSCNWDVNMYVTDCSNAGNITATTSNAGGIIAYYHNGGNYTKNKVENCTNTGIVKVGELVANSKYGARATYSGNIVGCFGGAVKVIWNINGDTSQTLSIYAGGSSNDANARIPKYTGATPTKADDENNRYTFAGWALTEGGQVVSGDLPYAVEDVTTFYAVWTAEKLYTITWNVDGTTTTSKYIKGETPNFTGSTAKEGYNFLGWATSVDGEVVEIPTVSEDKTYYAKFEQIAAKYTVTWVGASGTLETDANVVHGSNPTYNAETPVKDGYIFAGWALTEGGEVVDLATQVVDKDVSYYAIFTYSIWDGTYPDVTGKTEADLFGETVDGYYIIDSAEDLAALAMISKVQTTYGADLKFKQTVNIDLSKGGWIGLANGYPGSGWVGADVTTYGFNGEYDGTNKTIIMNETKGSNWTGLFWAIHSGTVKNLILDGSIISSSYSGTLAARVCGSATISGIINNIDITRISSCTDQNNYIGMIGYIGQGLTATINISDCINNGDVIGNTTADLGDHVGGIIGGVYGSSVALTLNMTDCINNGEILARGYAGGLVGMLPTGTTCNVTGCENNGNVAVAASYAGGIVATCNWDVKIKITDCVNTGSISATTYVGGIIAYMHRAESGVLHLNTVEGSTNSGTINVGGVVANSKYGSRATYGGNIIGCFGGNVTVIWNINGDTSNTTLLYAGGSGNENNGAMINPTYTGATPTKPDDENRYTFAGWALTEGGEVITGNLPYAVEDVTTFYAVFKAETLYTITWNVDGTETTSKYVAGETPEFTGSVAKEGYNFLGWATSVDGEVVEIPTVSEDKTYYAKFEQVNTTHTVTWIVNNETVETDTEVKYGSIPSVTATPSMEGLEFRGWATSENGQIVDLTKEIVTKDVTYYAIFYSVWDGTYPASSYSFTGEGTEASPYLIQSAQDLAAMSVLSTGIKEYAAGKYFKLMVNIDLSNGGKGGWIPICNDDRSVVDWITWGYFKGNFDGNGKTIHMVENYATGDSFALALFTGLGEGAVVKNLNFTGSITGKDYIAPLTAAINGAATIDNVTSSVNITSIHAGTSSTTATVCLGGIVSLIQEGAKGVSITNCSNSGNISGKSYGKNFGGIVSCIQRSCEVYIKNCTNTGNVIVEANSVYVGGVVGSIERWGDGYTNTVSVINCTNSGSISSGTTTAGADIGTASPFVGQLIGINNGTLKTEE